MEVVPAERNLILASMCGVAGVADKIYNLWSPVAFCGFFFVQYVCVCVYCDPVCISVLALS